MRRRSTRLVSRRRGRASPDRRRGPPSTPRPASRPPAASSAEHGDREHRFGWGLRDEASSPRYAALDRGRGGRGRPRRAGRPRGLDRAASARACLRLSRGIRRSPLRRPGERRIYSNTGYHGACGASSRRGRRFRSRRTCDEAVLSPLGARRDPRGRRGRWHGRKPPRHAPVRPREPWRRR